MTDDALDTICKNTNLILLEIKANSSSIITERGILFLVPGLRNLQSFALEYENYSDGRTLNYGDDKKFMYNLGLFILNHRLVSFSIDWPFNYVALLKILCNRNLKQIKISNSSSINAINELIHTNPLESIILQDINTRDVNETMNAIPVGIKHLELNGVCHFDMLTGLTNFSNLTTLIFKPTTRYASISPYLTTEIKQIAICCRKLKIVYLPIHDDETLIEFSKCPLVELEIQDGRGVTDDGLRKLKNLKHLGLGYSNMTDYRIVDGLQEFIMATPNRISQEGFRKMNNNLEYLGNINGYSLEFVLQEIGSMKMLKK
ncbi:hypothetical protein HK103_001446, partial [Boothiomyces macroporosus]